MAAVVGPVGIPVGFENGGSLEGDLAPGCSYHEDSGISLVADEDWFDPNHFGMAPAAVEASVDTDAAVREDLLWVSQEGVLGTQDDGCEQMDYCCCCYCCCRDGGTEAEMSSPSPCHFGWGGRSG